MGVVGGIMMRCIFMMKHDKPIGHKIQIYHTNIFAWLMASPCNRINNAKTTLKQSYPLAVHRLSSRVCLHLLVLNFRHLARPCQKLQYWFACGGLACRWLACRWLLCGGLKGCCWLASCGLGGYWNISSWLICPSA